jgi:hypothetical protein
MGRGHQKNECVVPSIRLNGKWLAALGLVPGQKMCVVTNGSIITIAPSAHELWQAAPVFVSPQIGSKPSGPLILSERDNF